MPIETSNEDAPEILVHRRKARIKIPLRRANFSVGQLVRVHLPKSPFSKAHQQSTTREIYKVAQILTKGSVPTYRLVSSETGVELESSVSEDQLAAV